MDKQKRAEFIDKLTGWSFYLLAAAVTFSNSFTEIATAIIIVTWLAKRVLEKDYKLPGGKLSLLLILFVLWNLASFINTAYIDESTRGLFKVIKHSLLFLASIDYFCSRQRLEKILLFSLGVCIVVSLNGIVQYIIGIDLIRQRTIDPLDYLHRASSSFRHANDFGAYLVVIITILFSLLFAKLRPLKVRVLLFFAILPCAWSLVATDSRGAWLGFMVALLCLVMIRSKKLLIIFLIMLLLSTFFLPGSIKDRFSDFSTIRNQGTVWERIKLWGGALNMIKEHPFLGFGVNTYTRNFPKYKPQDYPDVRYAHNSYLHMAAEIGIIGSGIFLVFLVALIIFAGKAMTTLRRGLERDLCLGLLAGTMGFLAHCAVDTHFYSVTLSAFLFLSLGLLAAFGDLAYEKRSE